MKKITGLFLSSLLTFGFAFAQEAATETEDVKAEKEKKEKTSSSSSSMSFTSKNGHEVLPTAGEFAIGANATPLIASLGSAGGSSRVGFLNNYQTIYGKYFLSDATAIRAQVRFGYASKEFNNYVLKSGSLQFDGGDQVEDKLEIASTYFAVGGGLEKRRGKGRLQGVYGADLLFHYQSQSEGYIYGNGYTLEDNDVDYTAWSVGNQGLNNSNVNGPSFDPTAQGVTQTTNGSVPADRILERQYDPVMTLEARVFAGVEYFFAPKISIGTEFGWGLQYQFSGNTTEKHEVYTNSLATEVRNVRRDNGTGLVIDTDNFSGNINVFFHF